MSEQTQDSPWARPKPTEPLTLQSVYGEANNPSNVYVDPDDMKVLTGQERQESQGVKASDDNYAREDNYILVRRSKKSGGLVERWVVGVSKKGEYEAVGPDQFDEDGNLKGALVRPLTKESFEPAYQSELLRELQEQARIVGAQALDSVSEQDPLFQARNYSVGELQVQKAQALGEQSATGINTAPQAALPEASIEKSKDPALKEIFKPLLRPELVSMGEEEAQQSYDYLFGNDEEHSRALADLADKDRAKDPIRRQQQEHDKYVNEETRKLAVGQLSRTLAGDPELATILAEHSFPVASIEAVDAIRTNEELRYAVGVHLLEKLNKAINKAPGTFGDRLIRNGEKSNDFHRLGKSRMSSRAYASTLALSMIDGSFNGLLQTDPTEYRDGQAISGQHRDAARTIL